MRQGLTIAIAAAGLALFYLFEASTIRLARIGDPVGPRAFPIMLGVAMLVCSAVLAMEAWGARLDRPVGASPRTGRAGLAAVAGVIVWTALYFLVLETLGYVLATILYLLPMMAFFNRGHWLANILTAVLFTTVLYIVFTRFLQVRLGAGLLPF